MQRFYAHGWIPKPEIINHLRKSEVEISDAEKAALRKEMCINIDAFVFCSFGMMAPTKLSQLVIQAFYKMFASAEANVLLFFVGQPAGGEYGEQILQLIEDNHLQDRVFITGYQSERSL